MTEVTKAIVAAAQRERRALLRFASDFKLTSSGDCLMIAVARLVTVGGIAIAGDDGRCGILLLNTLHTSIERRLYG